MNQKYLYFSTGAGINSIGEAVLYPVDNFRGMRPNSATTLDLFFDPITATDGNYHDYVRLTIKEDTHSSVIRSIQDGLKDYVGNILRIADMDGMSKINQNITSVAITHVDIDPIISYHKITGSTQVKLIDIDAKLRPIKSMSLANIHASDSVSVAVFLANPSDNWYILKNVVIPFGTTLILEKDEIDYNTSLFNLYVKLSAGDSAVDVIIRS